MSADASADPDAGAGMLTVRFTTNDGETPAGIAVFASAPDGSLFAETETDDDGEAIVPVLAEYSVTVAYHDEVADSYALHTIHHVAPGYVLLIGRGLPNDAGTTVDVTVPTKTNTDGYKVAHPCGSSSGPSNDLFAIHHDWCERDPYTILAVTSEDELATGYQFLDEVDLGTDPVVLDGAWQAVGTYGVSVTGIDDAVVDSVQVAERARRKGTAHEISRSALVDATTEAFTMDHLPTFGEEHDLMAVLVQADASQSFTHVRLELTGADAEFPAADFLPVLSPDMDYDTDSRTLSFDDPGEAWDVTDLELYYVTEEGGSGTQWIVEAPANGNDIALPVLPASLATWAPVGELTAYLTLQDTELSFAWSGVLTQPERARVSLDLFEGESTFDYRTTYVSSVIAP